MSPGVDNARLGVQRPEIQRASRWFRTRRIRRPNTARRSTASKCVSARHGFRRHELLGLNAFLLRTFQTKPNDDVLGVRLGDYMSGSTTDLEDAIGNVVRQARQSTAKVDVSATVAGGTVIANVGVLNLTGHRLPERRRFSPRVDRGEADGRSTARSCGRRAPTNRNGEIVDERGAVLPTEYFSARRQRQAAVSERTSTRRTRSRAPIRCRSSRSSRSTRAARSPRASSAAIITSRTTGLLPQGWRNDGPPGIALPANWLDATHPKGAYVTSDPRYADGKGRAVVTYRITLPPGTDRVAPARRRDAVVAVVGAGVQARAHARQRSRRNATALSAGQPASGRHAARGLEAPDRLGDGERYGRRKRRSPGTDPRASFLVCR